MDTTPNLDLPYIMGAQAQKHVTHNEALRKLDALVQLAVLDRDAATPPASPADGDRYIVAAGGTGAWDGHDLEIAAFQDGAWAFYAPGEGWLAWLADDGTLVAWDGSAWIEAGGGAASVNPAPLVGVNTTADATNRLAVKSDVVLFSHDDVTPGTGHLRVVVNKSATAKTAAVQFQRNWSGRAEIGLRGNDDLSFAVSPDGTTFSTPFTLSLTGSLGFWARNTVGGAAMFFGKERSTTNAYYYVWSDVGGFTSDAGGAIWRGLQIGGPSIGITYGGTFTSPLVAQYFEYDSNIDPTLSRFVWDVTNASGNTHDVIFRVNSTTDQLRLTATTADFYGSIMPRTDNARSLGASGRRFSEVWAATGTIQTSDARDKDVIARVDAGKAVAAIEAIEPVLFRWIVGGNEVTEDWQHTVVPPDAGADYDYDAALPTGETRVVPRAGQRTHAGFLAQEVKAALDAQEMDFGVWGLEDKSDPESRQWLRPDQLIPLLWAALRETRSALAALDARVAAIEGSA